MTDEPELEIVRFEPDLTVFLEPIFEADSFTELEERFRRGQRPEPWRRAGLWALDELRGILGEDWPGAAPSGWFPPELGAAYSHTREYTRLLELALRLHRFADASGIASLRNSLKTDRRQDRWLHISLQLEVAALAARAGADTSFESRQQGRYPADVRLVADELTIAIEAFSLLTSERWRAGVDMSDAISDRLTAIERRYGVACEVDFAGELLEPEALRRFLDQIELAAAVVAEGQPVDLARAGAASARVSRGDKPSFNGPSITENPWRRISARLADKREQTRESGERVWLRLDLLDGTWQFSPWSQAPLADKLAAFGAQIRHEFGSRGPLAGVVASSGSAMALTGLSDETVRAIDGSSALRRVIAPLRARETLVVPLGPDALEAGHFLRELYSNEAAWLDEALATEGLASTIEIFPRND
jgi:hypothetical protein